MNVTYHGKVYDTSTREHFTDLLRLAAHDRQAVIFADGGSTFCCSLTTMMQYRELLEPRPRFNRKADGS